MGKDQELLLSFLKKKQKPKNYWVKTQMFETISLKMF